MATWPALPFPQVPDRDGFEETAPKLGLSTEMDTGPSKQRKRFTAGVRPMTIMLRLTQAEVEQFDAFYLEAVGTIWDWVRPRDGSARRYRFVGDPPKYRNPGGDLWTVTFKVEEMPV